MGFMSLFSRKANAEKQQAKRLVKSQPYDNTVASLPPVRGIYPVAGNGPSAIETLSKVSKFSQSHTSLAETPAPAPVVPRFKDESTDRPSTAPNGSQPSRDWSQAPSRRRDSLRGPPVSFKKSKIEKSNSLTNITRPTSIEAQDHDESAFQALPDPTRAPFANKRTNLMRGDGGKGFVDLLDAQSEIKPPDFRSRVKAAGARDYGEDVADRNIGENGVDLDSSHVQQFYATSVRDQPETVERAGPAGASVRRIYNDAGLYHHITKQISMESGLRTKSMNSSDQYAFPKRTSSAVPRQPGPLLVETTPANTSRSLRRQSLNNFLPGGSTGVSNVAQVKLRPKSFHRGAVARDQGLCVSTKQSDQQHPDWEATPTGPDSYLPILIHSTKVSQGAKFPRDSVTLTRKETGSAPSSYDQMPIVPTEQFQFQFRVNDHPVSFSRPNSHRGSVASSTFTSPSKRPSKRHSLHTLQSTFFSSIASRDTATDFTPSAYPNSRPRSAKADGDIAGGTDASRDAAPSPCVRSGHSRNSSREDVYGYPRTRSLVSSPSKAKIDDLDEHVPLRTSSLRHWSISSSTTPTTASSSDNTFHRSHSRHTANTSVDLSNTFSLMGSSRDSIHSAFGHESFCTAQENPIISPVKPKTPGFNMDDYLSSDDDSFTAPRRPRGEGEEGLLFSDGGYGIDGSPLPGLEDTYAAPSSNALSRSPQSSMSLPPEALRQAYTTSLAEVGPFSPSRHSVRRRRYILDTPLDYDYDDDDEHYSTDGDDLLATIPRAPGQGLGMRGIKRISALGTPYSHGGFPGRLEDDVIEEERLEKIDIATAVRMRKEAKARKRAMTMAAKRKSLPQSKSKGKGKGKEVARSVEDEDEGCHADVE